MITIAVDHQHEVSALLRMPAQAKACYVFAHGAGAGMTHAFMTAAADGFHDRGIATLRYQFPFMERGSKRPDGPALAHATVRATVIACAALTPKLPLFAGGKSFGGRMTSQAQAEGALPGVRGLLFFGFPLHPANKPSVARAAHLAQVQIPMLFLQGSRDALADLTLLRPIVAALGSSAVLEVVEGADHAFHVPARSGQTDGGVLASLLDRAAAWMSAS